MLASCVDWQLTLTKLALLICIRRQFQNKARKPEKLLPSCHIQRSLLPDKLALPEPVKPPEKYLRYPANIFYFRLMSNIISPTFRINLRKCPQVWLWRIWTPAAVCKIRGCVAIKSVSSFISNLDLNVRKEFVVRFGWGCGSWIRTARGARRRFEQGNLGLNVTVFYSAGIHSLTYSNLCLTVK